MSVPRVFRPVTPTTSLKVVITCRFGLLSGVPSEPLSIKLQILPIQKAFTPVQQVKDSSPKRVIVDVDTLARRVYGLYLNLFVLVIFNL